jgi:hypothetical protein
VPPVKFFKERINGLTFAELLVILLFFVPKVHPLRPSICVASA